MLLGEKNTLFESLVNKLNERRRYFPLYLKLIIDGTGNYYIEAQMRNMERTDVIVDYRGEQLVIELKIWRFQFNRKNRQVSENISGVISFCLK